MARDPPPSRSSLDASPNLRDLPVGPSAIVKARPTIIHPQLRDLILPLERGRVLYPRGNSIEDLRFYHFDEHDEEEEGMKSSIRESTASTLVKLNFTPNCLVANKNILAAGGQHGELYITNKPSSPIVHPLNIRFPNPELRPFQISQSLQSRSINNSMILLPSYPHEWARQSERGRVGYKPKFAKREVYEDEDEAVDVDMDENEDVMMDYEEDEVIEEDDEEEEEEVEPHSPLTYPNTVPFLHAPRIPHLPSLSPSRRHLEMGEDRDRAGPSRRAVSFSDRQRQPQRAPTGLTRQSFSIPRPGSGLPPIEYVTSRPFPSNTINGSGVRRQAGLDNGHSDPRIPPRSRHRPSIDDGQQPFRYTNDEPRLLISNNDLTIKVFSLKPVDPSTSALHANPSSIPNRGPVRPNVPMMPMPIPRLRTAVDPLQDPGPRSNRIHSSYRPQEIHTRIPGEAEADRLQMSRDRPFPPLTGADAGEDDLRRATMRLARHRTDFERIVGMRVPPFSPHRNRSSEIDLPAGDVSPARVGVGRDGHERKLVRVGGTKFQCAINHSSLSPDLQHMVCVGDSEDVHLFEVIDGGRDFRKVTTYKGATDSGFSTAWSRDGRKFAVAAQDGQVTVWDHRSSNPLAKFYSSATGPTPRSRPVQSPSFSSDLMDSMNSDPLSQGQMPVLVDPVTGDARLGSSTSGREAARVVKFSPEGSSRDLLVFSEENTNIHIIDAQTLNSHMTIPVPYQPPTEEGRGGYNYRTGMEGGTWGIAGIAFDPTGEWLYSGTERTVVEWDLRRLGGGAGEGVWDMA